MSLKKLLFIFILLFFIPAGVHALTENTAYMAMVKIYAYAEDNSGNLEKIKDGSGAVIDVNGHILADYGLVTVADKDAVFNVCLAVSPSGEPNCGFSADLVAKDEARALAILKVRNIDGLSSQTSFLSLKREQFDNVRVGEIIRAIEFPAGDMILTNERSMITDTKDAHALSWIKIDAPFAPDSAGGIIINRDADILGFTSSLYADSPGQAGYLVNLPPHNAWIDSALLTSAGESSLQARMDALAIKQSELESTDIFTNDFPDLELTKNSLWEFSYTKENEIKVEDPEDSDSGDLTIAWEATDELIADNFSNYTDEYTLAGYEIVGEEPVSGFNAKKLVLTSTEPAKYQMLIGVKNYLIAVSYNYGEKDQSQGVIDSMINTLALTEEGIEFTAPEPEEEPEPEDEAENITEEVATTTDEAAQEEQEEPEEAELEVKTITSDFGKNLIGKILLEVELNGEAWYLSPVSGNAHFLGRPADAFSVMRSQGVGITNADLEKITIGTTDSGVGEKAANAFAEKHAGKIFLQVEENGEAWYVNPADNKRYFLGRPDDAFSIMRFFGLGISEANFAKL